MAAMSAAPGRFDALLASLAQQHGGVESLLDSFFDFLHRRTDFYAVTRDPAARGMGFRPGEAQDKVLRAFQKYPLRYLDGCDSGEASTKSAKPPAASSTASATPTAPRAATTKTAAPVATTVQLTSNGKQLPVDNGGSTDTYTWTQTLAEVSIQVELPEGTTAKDVECDITATHLRVALKPRNDRPAAVLIDGNLPERVRADDCVWAIESQRSLLVSLDKTRETWWASAVVGDPEIDTTKVDSTRRIDEYDPATQGAIRKAVFDQRQKQQGEQPATMEEELLERAKQLPGSPFV